MKRAMFLLVTMLMMSRVGYADESILNNGTIDEMISWYVYADGRLTLDGSGSIADYSSSSSVPWYSNRTAITSIELSGDISSIGKYAFYACTNVTQVTSNVPIPPTLAANTFNSSRLGSITLFVPSMYISDYQTAEYWNQMSVSSSDGGSGTMTDASAYLIAIYVDGSLLDGFDRYTFDYQVQLPEGTTTAPYVTYQAEDGNAIVNVSQADSPNGYAKIVVESYDGSMTNTYEIMFSATSSTGGDPEPGILGDSYTVYWSVNGTILSTTSVETNGMISELPETPTICDGYGYMYAGWTDTPISGSQGWEPSPLYTNTYEFPNVSQDVTYYAVFRSDATAGGGTYEMTDVLTREMTGVESGSTTYTDWSGVMASSSAMYAGNSAGLNDAIQMRSSGNNSGIITTATGGSVTMISVEWNSKTTDGQTLNVYGSYTPFSSVSELYSGSGTQIGTIVKGSNTDLAVSGYEYIGMRSNNGALYLNSISITWLTQGTGGTSEYVTSCGGSSTGGDAKSGTLENGQSWSLENGRLSLTGAGNIAGFDAPGDAPWYSHRNEITSIFLGADFFSIGGFVFYDLNNLTSISCPSSYMPTLQENTFSPGLLSQITATVRANLLSEYQADPYWSQMTLETYPDSGGDDTPTVYAEGYAGDGDGLHWIIYNNGQMTIDGVGALPDFSDYTLQPWAEFRDQIIDVNLNGQITSVGSYAFAQCQNLNTVLLSSSTNQLGDYAFSECPSLTRITAPAYEVMSSSELAFGNSYDREKLTIEVPESMVDAYKGAMFWYEFKIVAIGGDSTSKDDIVGGLVEGDIRWSFNSNTGLLSIYGFGAMPDWVQSMAPWGSYVDSIQEVEVCYGITYVCNGAFANSLNITKVTLAASVDSIGEYIFTGNYSPIQLYVQNMTPPGITTNTFANVNGCVYAYCYESAFPAYDSKPLWNEKVCLGFDTDPEDPNLQSYQLQMIYINNVALADFNPDQYSYNITLPADSETPLVTYKPGYTSQSITIEQASSTDGTAYIHVNESATYSLYFSVEGGSSQQGGDQYVTFELDTTWQFIMLPTIFGLEEADVTVSGEVEWATYNGMQRASGGSGWTYMLSHPTVDGSVAYIVRPKSDSTMMTIRVPESANTGEVTMALPLSVYASKHPENANWNFIGNPYNAGYSIRGLAAAGIESPVTVWNGTGYSTYMPGVDEYTIKPFEAFFIQLPDSAEVTEIPFMPEYIDSSMSMEGSSADPTGGNGNNPGGIDGVADAYGALPGFFSVGEGIQVQFSRGNLQYNALKSEWQFADQQYDYIGEDNANISDTYEGWIDLFGWGTGAHPTLASTTAADYSTFVDWGSNAISNGGNIPNAWRTLTSDEWNYLFSGRTNAAQLYGLATVNGVSGLILLADDWQNLPDLNFTSGTDSYTSNVFSEAEWGSMQAAGAVFLPAAGFRSGLSMYNLGMSARYWSSTSANSSNSFAVSVTSSSVESTYSDSCFGGLSVRLVRDH